MNRTLTAVVLLALAVAGCSQPPQDAAAARTDPATTAPASPSPSPSTAASRPSAADRHVLAVGQEVLDRLGVTAPATLNPPERCPNGNFSVRGFWTVPLRSTNFPVRHAKRDAVDWVHRMYRDQANTIVHYGTHPPSLSVHVPATDTAVVLDGGDDTTVNLMVISGCRYSSERPLRLRSR